jgi:hypothetical protein
MTGKLRVMHLLICIFIVGTTVGCGGGGGSDSKVVHSKEDRLKYIAEMEAMEKGTATIMKEQSQEKATE